MPQVRGGHRQPIGRGPPIALLVRVKVGVGGHQVSQLIGGVDRYRQGMVEVVGGALGDALLSPGAGKLSTLHDQDIDLVALPGQRAAVVGPRGEQTIDVAPVLVAHSATEQTPLMDTKSLDPERHLPECGPQVEGNH